METIDDSLSGSGKHDERPRCMKKIAVSRNCLGTKIEKQIENKKIDVTTFGHKTEGQRGFQTNDRMNVPQRKITRGGGNIEARGDIVGTQCKYRKN